MQPRLTRESSSSSALGKRKLQDAEKEPKGQSEPNGNASDSDSEQSPSDDGGYRDEEEGEEEEEEEEELVLDRKHLLIVKDGTIRVAESLEQQQFDANGEAIKASGTWTKAEHDRFLKAMETYPKGPWKAIAAMIGTRTVRQTQTHAQKYREKMARRMRGLRNRNGTLQYPGLSATSSGNDAAGMYGGYSEYAVAVGDAGTVASHDRVTALYHPASAYTHRHYQFPQEQYPHVQQQVFHSQPVYHQVLPVQMVVAHAHPAASSSMEFGQLSQQSMPSAFITTGAAYPATWDPRQVVSGSAVPLTVSLPPPPSAAGHHRPRLSTNTPSGADFDESMDFLMHMYSAHPSQLASSASASEDSASFSKRDTQQQ